MRPIYRGQCMTLDDAIASLYRIATVERKRTSTLRLRSLADYCVQELARRGLNNASTETPLPGGARTKQWDVAWELQEKPRLAISLKSILRNIAGTVPNRVDDLMGEVVNLQMYSPEVVIGYVMVFDVATDTHSDARGGTWCDLLRGRLDGLSERRPPSWSVGMIEAYSIIEVDFTAGPAILTSRPELNAMFDTLAEEVRRRNPSLLK